MAITPCLPPENEQTLRRRAELAGLDVAEYLSQGVGLTDAPLLSVSDVSREGIYRDHD